MNLKYFFTGILTVEITSAEPEKLLELIIHNGIKILNITQKSELTYLFQITQKDYQLLCMLLSHREDKPKVIHRYGLHWHLKALIKHPVLLLGLLLLTASSIFLPTRILFVEVSGNKTVSAQAILEAAETCGIRFGVSRKQIRSEKVKNALLDAVPQLEWAGVNTAGCRAVLSVREKTENTQPPPEPVVSSLIAERDGFILDSTVISGTPMVQPGDVVRKGQTLISGYTDCGIKIQASRAYGEILAQTNRHFTAVCPENLQIATSRKHTKYNLSLLFRKKRIILWKDSRIFDSNCGRMYSEYFVRLPGGFQLPFAICVDRYFKYDTSAAAISEADARKHLQDFSDQYLRREMLAGQILQRQHTLTASDGLYILDSRYTCTELIGIEQPEQTGAYNGKRD